MGLIWVKYTYRLIPIDCLDPLSLFLGENLQSDWLMVFQSGWNCELIFAIRQKCILTPLPRKWLFKTLLSTPARIALPPQGQSQSTRRKPRYKEKKLCHAIPWQKLQGISAIFFERDSHTCTTSLPNLGHFWHLRFSNVFSHIPKNRICCGWNHRLSQKTVAWQRDWPSTAKLHSTNRSERSFLQTFTSSQPIQPNQPRKCPKDYGCFSTRHHINYQSDTSSPGTRLEISWHVRWSHSKQR